MTEDDRRRREAAAYACVLACDCAARANLTVSDVVRLIRAAWKLRIR